jgi:hypothetical protein
MHELITALWFPGNTPRLYDDQFKPMSSIKSRGMQPLFISYQQNLTHLVGYGLIDLFTIVCRERSLSEGSIAVWMS